MGFKCGIVGLPNVGKSTLFNALTKAGVAAANYPFCTIDPNVGVVPVPDPRLYILADIAKTQKIVPTSMQFVDIAGLVKGASQGEGLGNQFLANIRETQAIAHVIRCFEDDDITHVAGKVDPVADIEIIHTELALADLDCVSNAVNRHAKAAKSGDKQAKQRVDFLEELRSHLNTHYNLRKIYQSLDEEMQQFLKSLQLLTAKPTLYIANVDEASLRSGNAHVRALERVAAEENAPVVMLCAALEAEIAQLDAADQADFLKSAGLEEPGLNRVIRAGYDLLGLQTYFTAGVKETRAWTIPKGATAPEAAGAIHTDFTKGFIRAEVIAYDDYVRFDGESGAKEAGKWRLEGKEYIVKDGDVIFFRFNV